MRIETFDSRDIDRVVALWKRVLPYLIIDRSLLIKKVLLEPNFSPDGFL